jgi:N-formylmaleamate deformylase
MDAWQDGYVHTNGIRLHYWRTGGNKSPVVLLHGITDNGLCWTRVAKRLAEEYELIMLDHRGHGLSDQPESGYELTDYATDAAGLIEELGLGQPAVIGHSLGAATGATLAATRPDLVRCLILEDPPWRQSGNAETEEQRQARMLAWREETRQRKEQMSHSEIVAQSKARSTTWHEDEFDSWADAKLQVTERVFNNSGVSLRNWPDMAGKIQCATLLIGGDPERDGIIVPDLAQYLMKQNTNIQYIRLTGAGHNIRREQFEPYVAAVQEFLAHHYPSREKIPDPEVGFLAETRLLNRIAEKTECRTS